MKSINWKNKTYLEGLLDGSVTQLRLTHRPNNPKRGHTFYVKEPFSEAGNRVVYLKTGHKKAAIEADRVQHGGEFARSPFAIDPLIDKAASAMTSEQSRLHLIVTSTGTQKLRDITTKEAMLCGFKNKTDFISKAKLKGNPLIRIIRFKRT